MQSFAFWYKGLDSKIKAEAKLNFNLWANCEFQKDSEVCLDIGILIKNTKNIKQDMTEVAALSNSSADLQSWVLSLRKNLS